MHRALIASSIFAMIAWVAMAIAVPRFEIPAADASATFDTWTEAARYEIEYRVELSSLPQGEARIWLPLPAENEHQQVLSLEIDSPWSTRQTADRFGNRILYTKGSVDGGNVTNARLVTRHLVVRRPTAGIDRSVDPSMDASRFLRPARRIPLDGVIADIAEREGATLSSDLEKLRAFYDYVVRNMTYSKHGEGWGNGDAIWACTSKYGNCTDFHSLFLGLARAQGFPARFVIGFGIPDDLQEGQSPGYHCWAEAFDSLEGWFPLDASAARISGRLDDYFGTLPSDRVEFTIGRDLVLEPPQAGEPLNFFIHPHVEVDGIAVEGLKATLHFRRLPPSEKSG